MQNNINLYSLHFKWGILKLTLTQVMEEGALLNNTCTKCEHTDFFSCHFLSGLVSTTCFCARAFLLESSEMTSLYLQRQHILYVICVISCTCLCCVPLASWMTAEAGKWAMNEGIIGWETSCLQNTSVACSFVCTCAICQAHCRISPG